MKNSSSFNKSLQTLKVLSLAIILALGIHFVSVEAAGWSSPTAAPPGNNTAAPLNVGSVGQIKDGGLTLGSALTSNATVLNLANGKLLLRGATGSAGQVLKADPSGQAVWGPDNTGGGSSLSFWNHTTNIGQVGGFFVRNTSPFILNNTNYPGIGLVAELLLKDSHALPQGCANNQIPKWNSTSGGWACQPDNGGNPSVSGNCTFVYGSGSGGQDMVCPSGQAQAGVRVIDTNSNCNMGTNVNTCGARVVAIRCCTLQ